MTTREITLTPEQLEEFGTPNLKTLAEAYIRFRHSSPYTAERKIYKYFEPLPPEKLTDKENIYGADREKAYSDLMTAFDLCRFTGDLERLFDDRHRHHWASKTVKGLVILRKWLGNYDRGTGQCSTPAASGI